MMIEFFSKNLKSDIFLNSIFYDWSIFIKREHSQALEFCVLHQ